MKRRVTIMLILAIISSCFSNIFPVGILKKTIRADAMKVISMSVGKTKKYVYKKRKVKRWKSSNTKVALVKKKGKRAVKIRARKKGTAIITGYTSKGKIKFKIKVKARKKMESGNYTSETSLPQVSPDNEHKIKLEENITGEVIRLSSGRILFKVKNNNNQFIYQANVTFGLFDYNGAYIDKYVVSAKYLQAQGYSYYCVNPEPYWGADSVLEKVRFANTKVRDVDVIINENWSSITESNISSEIIKEQVQDMTRSKLCIKNNNPNRTWIEWVLLYEDKDGNVVDASTGYGSKVLDSGEIYSDYINTEIKQYYTDELIQYETVKVIWNAASKK